MITIGGARFTVAQAAAEECTYLLSHNSENFYSTGGVGRVDVVTTPDCSWVARTTEDWIAVIAGDRGVG